MQQVHKHGRLRNYNKNGEGKFDGVTIPCISAVRAAFKRSGHDTGYMSQTESGTPIDLTNLYDDVIKPRLVGTRLKWRGWHAFRRGTATMLYNLGVAPEVALLILRNDVGVLRKHYLKLDAQKQRAEPCGHWIWP